MKAILFSSLALFASLAFGAAGVGTPAPDFSLTGNDGKVHKLSDFKGKDVVVLEWFNPGCPYVHKHYDSGNMQRLQKEFTSNGVKWFTIGHPQHPGSKATSRTAAKLKRW